MKKKIKTAIFFISVGFVIASIGALVSAEMVGATSDEKFCGSCHSMKPMIEAYKKSVHGGANDKGLVVRCTDCHLPHTNVVEYLFQKAKSGSHDMYVETLGNPGKIDWEAKRSHRERFVYDSACLFCHKGLRTATMSNAKAFIAHKNYFSVNSSSKCVTCHEHVGHKNLGLYLKKPN